VRKSHFLGTPKKKTKILKATKVPIASSVNINDRPGGKKKKNERETDHLCAFRGERYKNRSTPC
jgi:hypothetical protein